MLGSSFAQAAKMTTRPVEGAMCLNGGHNPQWWVKEDGGMGISMSLPDGHRRSTAIARDRILKWTNEDNDALQDFANAGLDFTQNHDGARQLIKSYLFIAGQADRASRIKTTACTL